MWHPLLAVVSLVAATSALAVTPAPLRERFGYGVATSAALLVALVLRDLTPVAVIIGVLIATVSLWDSPRVRRPVWVLALGVAALGLWLGIPDTEAPLTLLAVAAALMIIDGGHRGSVRLSIAFGAAPAALIWASVTGSGSRGAALLGGLTIAVSYVITVAGASSDPRRGAAMLSAMTLIAVLVSRVLMRWSVPTASLAMVGCLAALLALSALLVRWVGPARRRR